VREGHQLFVKQFVEKEPSRSSGDGLGPLFNHVSCVACHRQGAIGGGGGIEFNVSLLCAQLANPSVRPSERLLLINLRNLHPALVSSDGKIVPNILLHRFGPGERYFQFRGGFGLPEVSLQPDVFETNELQRELAREPLPTAKTRGAVKVVRTQRNTTALFGAGLIDKVPASVLHSLAAQQAKQGDVTGRVPPIGPEKVGRFGWRGQQERLADFVLGACANELGLEVPGNAQPMDPLRPKYRPGGLDLTSEQCASLTAYVGALPQPRFVAPATMERRQAASRGRELFGVMGCAACHVERVGLVGGIYSDLLLHDMGPKLVDPVLAEATLILEKRRLPEPQDPFAAAVNTSLPRGPEFEPAPQPAPATYYGGSTFQGLSLAGSPPARVTITDPKTRIISEYRVQQTSLENEWRTPPLWGVADSAPYLHDGRAATILDAITLHGGEAEKAKVRFFNFPEEDRDAVVVFLNCLRAP